MSWKDYLFYSKGDKLAIILLSVLIVLSGGFYIGLRTVVPKPIEYPTPLVIITNNSKIPVTDSAATNQEEEVFPNHTKPYYSTKLSKGQTVNLNKADTTELKKIPGIGTSYSNRIVKYRNLLGRYAKVEQLKEVYGMDDELYRKIKPYVVVNGKPKQLTINSLESKTLSKHPYINYKQTRVIEKVRNQYGKLTSWEELEVYDEFTVEDIKRLKPYISFE